MGVSSSKLEPEELLTFKKISTDVPLDNIEIPELPENRVPTNVKWLNIMGIFIALLLPFMIYTLCYSDIRRLSVDYDQCGNICGEKNYRWDNIACSGQDFTSYPYLQYDRYFSGGSTLRLMFAERHCVKSCSYDHILISGRCFKGDDSDVTFYGSSIDFGVYFDSVKWQIVISCLLSILVAMGMLFLFRFAVAFVVWGILIGSFLGFLILVAVFWYLYFAFKDKLDQTNKTELLGFTVFLTIFASIMGVMMIWSRKKIRLVIMLLKEATKAVFDMPGLTTIPVICVIAIFILSFFYVLTTFYMSSVGTLEHILNDFYIYIRDPVTSFTMFYNLVVYLWIIQFFTGIQYMIIAGAVSKWYFARDKSLVGTPIMTSVSNTFRFHLGTVALGSLIITIVQVIKSIILSIIKNEKIRAFVQCAIESVETFFKFLSKNAYIISAMHGQSFIKSGKRAARLIIQNINDIIAVNFIGDFVLGMAKILIIVITMLLSLVVFTISPGEIPDYNFLAYMLIAVVSTVIACVAFGVFETTIDTLFICYCEDNILNDGMARPFFMSRDLMEFVQSSKAIYGKK